MTQTAELREKIEKLEQQKLQVAGTLLVAESDAAKERKDVESFTARYRAERKRVLEGLLEAQTELAEFEAREPEFKEALSKEQAEYQAAMAEHLDTERELKALGGQLDELRAVLAELEAKPKDPPPSSGPDFAAIAAMTFDELKADAAKKLVRDGVPRTRTTSVMLHTNIPSPVQIHRVDGKCVGSKTAYNLSRGGATADLGPARDLSIKQVSMVHNDHVNETHWWMRGYNIHNLHVSGAKIVGQPIVDAFGNIQHSPLEHAFYLSCSGDTLFEDSYFAKLGGHPIYVTSRAYPYQNQYLADNHLPTAFQKHEVVRCGIVDTEMFARRGSSPITHFDAGTLDHRGSISIRDTHIINKWGHWRPSGTNVWYPEGTQGVYGLRECEGMFVHATYSLEAEHARTGLEGHLLDFYEIDNCRMVRGFVPNKAFGTIKAAQEIRFKDSYLRDGGGLNIIEIDDPKLPSWCWSDRVIAENVRTNLVARVTISPTKTLTFSLNCPGGSIRWERGMDKPEVA